MKKHEFNIFPDMSVEEFNRLKADIQTNGFDPNYPIMLYDNHTILDGWHRWKACDELKKTPLYDHFTGTDEEALAFVMRSNKRRNITSEQWAVLAVQSGTILVAIQKQVEAEAAERMLAGKSDPTTSVNRVKEDKNKNTTKALVAERVNTTPKLLAAAKNLKEENPEEFSKMADDILKGDTTIRKIKASKKKAAALVTKVESINVVTNLNEADEMIAAGNTLTNELIELVTVNEESEQAKIDAIFANPPEHVDIEDTDSELTDAEILQMVKRVKNKVIRIAKLITNRGMDNESIEMNRQHFEAIEKLQLDLGIRLTGFKK
jgi:hypothetical protein